jgi:hypothetical protein
VCTTKNHDIRPAHSVIVSQPERYSRLISCEFRFSSDVGFFYEDIRAAFLDGSTIHAGQPDPGSIHGDERQRNDCYLSEVLEFCKAHWSEIVRKPPFWYEQAVEICDKSTRSVFPSIADEDLENKIRLLKTWRNDLDR